MELKSSEDQPDTAGIERVLASVTLTPSRTFVTSLLGTNLANKSSACLMCALRVCWCCTSTLSRPDWKGDTPTQFRVALLPRQKYLAPFDLRMGMPFPLSVSYLMLQAVMGYDANWSANKIKFRDKKYITV